MNIYDLMFGGSVSVSMEDVYSNVTACIPQIVMITAALAAFLIISIVVRRQDEAKQLGITGWYGPGMNIHRSAFSGRNFEYYSEDSTLTGIMGGLEVKGATEQGMMVYMKHFALNDQETNRTNGICTWSTEQAIREIYLKAFEYAVKEGGTTAVMTSFNSIGNEWAGSNEGLLTGVLRNEWGFRAAAEGRYVTERLRKDSRVPQKESGRCESINIFRTLYVEMTGIEPAAYPRKCLKINVFRGSEMVDFKSTGPIVEA